MSVAMMGSGGGSKLQLLTTVTYSPINISSNSTSSSQSYDLSSYGVSGKSAEDFFICISGFITSAAEKQSRAFNSLKVTGFSGSTLTLTGTYDYYNYHAINLGLTVDIYVYK